MIRVVNSHHRHNQIIHRSCWSGPKDLISPDSLRVFIKPGATLRQNNTDRLAHDPVTQLNKTPAVLARHLTANNNKVKTTSIFSISTQINYEYDRS